MGLWSYIKSFFQKEDISANVNASANTNVTLVDNDREISVLRSQLENYENAFASIFEDFVKIFVMDIEDYDELDVEFRIRDFRSKHTKTVKYAMGIFQRKYGNNIKTEHLINAMLIISSIKEHRLKVFKSIMKEEPFTNPDYSSFDLFDVLAEGDDYEATLMVFDPLKKLIFESIYHYAFELFIKACAKYRSTECILALKDTYPDVCKKHHAFLKDNDLLDTF